MAHVPNCGSVQLPRLQVHTDSCQARYNQGIKEDKGFLYRAEYVLRFEQYKLAGISTVETGRDYNSRNWPGLEQ